MLLWTLGCIDSLNWCFRIFRVQSQLWYCWGKRQFHFSFMGKFHTVFHSGCTSLHSHQDCTRVPFSLQPPQHFLFLDLFMIPILTSVKWYLIVVSICISLMASNAEVAFIGLWALCVLLGEVSVLQHLNIAHCLIGLFVYLEWSLVSSLCIELSSWSSFIFLHVVVQVSQYH